MNAIEERFERELDDAFDLKLDELLEAHRELHLAAGGASGQTGGGVKEYQTVGPAAREKLKGILKYYAKKPHPFTACVNDNRKRFGPRAEAVCAVLKDIIRNTTKWRGKNNPNDHGAPGIAGLDYGPPEIDAEVLELIDRLDEMELWELMALADDRLDDEGKKIEFADYTPTQRKEMAKKGHALPDGSFPIANKADLKNAIQAHGRAKNKKVVKNHIIKRARALKATEMLPAKWPYSRSGPQIAQVTPQAAGNDPYVDTPVRAPGG